MAASGSKSMPTMQDEEKIEDPPQEQPKWWAIWCGQPSIITFPFTLAFMATLVLALILAFLGAESLRFCGATVKKGAS